jgi:hypothetical protein
MALWIGLYPKPFFQILEQPVNQIVQTIHNNSNPNAPANALLASPPAQAGENVTPKVASAKIVTAKIIAAKTVAGMKGSN